MHNIYLINKTTSRGYILIKLIDLIDHNIIM